MHPRRSPVVEWSIEPPGRRACPGSPVCSGEIDDGEAMRMTDAAEPKPARYGPDVHGRPPLPVLRALVGGLLMGLAMLVPGVSGGTMILVMGLYDEFIGAVADVTRLRFTRRGVVFLCLIGVTSAVAVTAFAGTLSRAVTLHPSAMFSLFIGMTLGGVPLLARMHGRPTPWSVAGIAIGLAIMVAIALDNPPDAEAKKDAVRQAVAAGTFVIEADYTRDLVAGLLGMSAMVLPGISGAYMVLILGRYETILAAIAAAKTYALSLGREGSAGEALHVIVPVAVGAIISLVGLSNLLKWMLERHKKPTLGLLLGILLGSVIGIWPFDAASTTGDIVVGAALAAGGFVFTVSLSRLRA